jgi:hypothetical protein
MTRLANDFSWSHSRHEVFQTCLKRYFFAYYGAWGGWEPAAPARTRELYRLKRLHTRAQWSGHHVHQAVEFLLKAARRDPSGALAATAETRQIEAMRQEFRDSRSGAYRADPVRIVGLFEHEYQLDVPPAEWKATVDRAALAIRNFLASDLWSELRQLPDEAILAVERRSHFVLNGLKVHAVPDLAVRREGRVRIYDWKTGTTDPAAHRTQLGVYALLATDRWTAAPEEIEAVVYNPVLDRRASFTYSADDLETLRDFIRDSAEEMLFPLANPEANDAADGEGFDCTESDAPCKSCPFLRACPRWTG